MYRNEVPNNSKTLNIAGYITRTTALGPGERGVVWTQGCPFRCPGCVAPDWIPFIEARRFSPEELLTKFDLDQIQGLTFSGGEPMEQASSLAELARLSRRAKDLSLICFTGYKYERLLENPPNPGVKELLAEVDILIDGPYVYSLNQSIGLRGSSNQRIIHLTSRLKKYDLENQRRKVEITIEDGQLSFVGIPSPAIKSAVEIASIAGFERKYTDERL